MDDISNIKSEIG